MNTDGKLRNRRDAPVGAISMEARKEGLNRILAIQAECVQLAPPEYQDWRLICDDDIAFIRQCHENNINPNGWTGNEPIANELYVGTTVHDGKIIAIQPLLFKL